MTNPKWEKNSQTVEQLLGFLADCPRCRAWNLWYQLDTQLIHIKCQFCGLEFSIYKQSLVNYTGIPLQTL